MLETVAANGFFEEDQLNTNSLLWRGYSVFICCFIGFVGVMAIAEQRGLSDRMIGYAFLFATILIYAGVGVFTRTSEPLEFYVAGRRVPAVFSGMATAADWMSAASFVGLAGALYHSGFEGLAFITGWLGGFLLVGLLIAPYLRRFGQYTIPDFLAARYEGNTARFVGVAATVLTSFVYLVAQLYAVGLIVSRCVNVQLEVGLVIGLAGVLVCSFLGGMRSVTWTQVTQYIIMFLAYLVPIVLLSSQLSDSSPSHNGSVFERARMVETELRHAPSEREVRKLYRQRAVELLGKIAALPESLDEERDMLRDRIRHLTMNNASAYEIASAQRALRDLPATPEEARLYWRFKLKDALQRLNVSRDRFRSDFSGSAVRNNFLALVFVLVVGTAALPHILVRYYTTSNVVEARRSVYWSVLFIVILYIGIPLYAAGARLNVMESLVGIPFENLPEWIAQWSKLGMVHLEDINGDGIMQWTELSIDTDAIMLAVPEIAGMPYVISGLVAAGGLAAALSSSDALLLSISNSISHDLYYKIVNQRASIQQRLTVAKAPLILCAGLAAWMASMKPDQILFIVGFAFSLGAASFFPALVLGIFWKRANRTGAISGILAGLGMTLYYLARTHPYFGGTIDNAWFDIAPVSAGVFGVPVGFVTIVVFSLFGRLPSENVQSIVRHIRRR